MASILLTPPAAEPLSLAEAKAFLRLETADDDPLIAAFISAARLHVETQTGLALITQSWRMVLDCWPANGRIAVRPAPLQALTAARVFDSGGEARASDIQAFVPDASTSTLSFIPCALPMPSASRRHRVRHRRRLWRCRERRAGANTPGDPDSGGALARKPRDRCRRGGSAGAIECRCADRALPDAAAVSAPLKDIGALNRRLVLEALAETGDGAGGVVRTYEALTTLWAQVTPVSARGDIAADSLGAALRHRIVIRTRGGISTRYRLRDGARVYRIVALRESAGRRFLEIDAEERED